MTNSSHDHFDDKRTPLQQAGELATSVLWWYNEEGKGMSWRNLAKGVSTKNVKMKRRRTCGVAITTAGQLIYAESVCSRKDQFIKAKGRFIVESRILGRAQQHCWILTLDDGDPAEAAVASYRMYVPEDEVGAKRAYNAGRIFDHYKAEIHRRASEVDEF